MSERKRGGGEERRRTRKKTIQNIWKALGKTRFNNFINANRKDGKEKKREKVERN
jgi:hypothetical protein